MQQSCSLLYMHIHLILVCKIVGPLWEIIHLPQNGGKCETLTLENTF